ncbi:MAG: VIT1/CCC1 transporter family protein [Ilumatobacteraceae bacterium]
MHGLGDHSARERHLSGRAAWLRAAVLGANDGLISTTSLMVGVAAAEATRASILTAGIAGLTAGALSMAAGEYVSVSSQRDVEQADLARESLELSHQPGAERDALMYIYMGQGLSEELAAKVADELSGKTDPAERLAIHAREELGIDVNKLARPIQAAVVSALSFIVGAVLPIVVMAVAGKSFRTWLTIGVGLVGLVTLGWLGAQLGGASRKRAALRVLVGGALAFAISLGIGHLTGAVV